MAGRAEYREGRLTGAARRSSQRGYRSKSQGDRGRTIRGLREPLNAAVATRASKTVHGQRYRLPSSYLLGLRDLPRLLRIGFESVRFVVALIFARILGRHKGGPVRVRMMFERLGATFLKLGQILAMRPDFLPIEYCNELMKLLDRLPPFSAKEARAVVARELGAPPEQIYAFFSPFALAAATFGQVHEARLVGGQVVVVKIQRPGIEVEVERDLRIMFFGARVADVLTGSRRLVPKVQEFARWTREELDYRWEAKHQHQFAHNLRDVDSVCVPRVYFELTARRVLTMEKFEGISLANVLRAINSGDEEKLRSYASRGFDGNEVARNLHFNFLSSAFVHNLFHADQHAGNLMVMPGNRIGYLDFGIVGKWDRKTQEIGLRFVRALASEDFDEAFEVFIHESTVPSAKTRMVEVELELKAAFRDWTFHSDFPGATTAEKSMAHLLLRILDITRRHAIDMPLETLAYYRTMITLDSLYLSIGPGYDVRRGGAGFYRAAIANRVLDGVASPAGLRTMVLQYLDARRRRPGRDDREAKNVDEPARLRAEAQLLRSNVRGVRRSVGWGAVALCGALVVGAGPAAAGLEQFPQWFGQFGLVLLGAGIVGLFIRSR